MANEVLFLTGSYLPNPGANGIISDILINKLIANGKEITVLSTKTSESESNFQIIEKKRIYRISISKFTRKLNKGKIDKKIILIHRRIKTIFNLYKFPDFDSDQNTKTYLKIREILLNNSEIDDIVCIHKPYTNIEALKRIKIDFPDKKCIIYCLDFFDDIKRPKIIPQQLFTRFLYFRIKKILEPFDYFFVSENKKEIFDDDYLKELKRKMEIFYYPTLNIEDDCECSRKKNKNNCFSFIYAGTLDKLYRDPYIFLKTCSTLINDGNKLEVDIFGKNDIEDYISEFGKKYSIKNHGFQSKAVISSYISNADFLINISNEMENTIPSKIFELFATGKPIINYVKNKNDKTLEYFNQYPLTFNFYEQEAYESQVKALAKFVKENYNKKIDKKRIKEIFFKNTPEYNIEKILRILNNDNQ